MATPASVVSGNKTFGGMSLFDKHLAMPLALVGILTILILPLPTIILDLCLALNITISMVVLFVSLYMLKPLQFSSFPAVLLVTTLFRLAMNVASTRLILLNGDQGLEAAGSLIAAFGGYVVGGNYAVGAVIFILISLVNLKVITKGSGRIAEVAARFTLDAMPGKQMAIDSDLNTGLIGEDEAKRRRKELAQEAEFYGAMDGSAKFVAGDAIAGVFITGINIVGGFFIGILQKDMDWMYAAETYTILTIGDGLISQLPSIIVSVASGLIVARAGSGDDLGTEVIGQLGMSHKPLLLTSAICGAAALVPGLPFFPFMALSLLSGAAGVFKLKSEPKKENDKKIEQDKKEKDNQPKPGSSEEVKKLLPMDTLELEIGFELVPLVDETSGGDLIERIRSLRRQFAIELGFIVPPIHIRDNVRIGSTQYRVMLRGAEIGGGSLKPRHLLAMDPGNVTSPISGIPTKEPAFGLDALWVPDSDREKAQFSGYTVVDLSTVVTTHLTELIKSHAHELLGRQEVQDLVEGIQKESPKIVEELIPGVLNVGQIQQILANLLREHVSIRDLRTILETLGDWAPQTKNIEKLSEQVRRRLSRTIVSKFTGESTVLTLTSFTPSVERVLADGVQHTDEGSFLALDPSYAQVLINKLNHLSDKFGELGQNPVILSPSHLRPALFHFVERFAPGYSVLSHHEIPPTIKVQSVGVISMDEVRPALGR